MASGAGLAVAVGRCWLAPSRVSGSSPCSNAVVIGICPILARYSSKPSQTSVNSPSRCKRLRLSRSLPETCVESGKLKMPLGVSAANPSVEL
eukprot:4780649-Prymnesium_polylepis.1